MEPAQPAQWLRQARQGDRLALAKLLTLHYPRLAARAAERLDPALRPRVSPDDVVQEVYCQVFQTVGTLEDRGPEAFFAWLTAILDHKLIDFARAGHRACRDIAREAVGAGPRAAGVAGPRAAESTDRSVSYRDLLAHVCAASPTPSRIIRREEAIIALLNCLDRLEPAHRAVLELRFLEGLPLKAVAERLARSEDAVVALTQRALRALHEAMDGLGEFTGA